MKQLDNMQVNIKLPNDSYDDLMVDLNTLVDGDIGKMEALSNILLEHGIIIERFEEIEVIRY